jgi:hypothetical protein
MSPRWQRILISGGVAIAVGAVAVPAVIGYALVRSNNEGPDAEVAQITNTVTVSATAMTTPRAALSPTLSTVTPTPEATLEVTQEPLAVQASPSAAVEDPPALPQEELPSATPTLPPATPTIEPVASSIFIGPGVLFEPEDAVIDGLTVTVQGAVYSRDFKIARIVWDWGDDPVEEGWFPARHAYTEPGRYMWSVSVYDDGGTKIAGRSSPVDVGQ